VVWFVWRPVRRVVRRPGAVVVEAGSVPDAWLRRGTGGPARGQHGIRGGFRWTDPAVAAPGDRCGRGAWEPAPQLLI